jgi:hypothetical protein
VVKILKPVKKKKIKREVKILQNVGGSGWVAVAGVALERGDRGGQNGVKFVAIGRVLGQ